MQTLSTQQTRQMLDGPEDLVLINVLPRQQFQEKHIPGSVNVPVGADDFLKKIEDEAGSKSAKIVVYCANHACDASPKAAKKLEEAGFENVYDFEGGVKEWEEAGHPLEGSAVSARS